MTNSAKLPSLANTWRALALLVLLGFVLRVLWLVLVPTVPEDDALWFYDHAINLVEEGDFVANNGAQTAERLVGYPAILASLFVVFGTSYNVGKVLNLLLSVVILLASFDIARQTFRSNRIALWTVALLAIFPNYIAYTSTLLSEITFTALFLVGISLILRLSHTKWLWLPIGVIFGVCTLIKTYFVLTPLVVWGWLVWRRGVRKHHFRVVFAMLVSVMVLLPWLYRNWRVFDAFPILSNTTGFNLWIGHHPNATGFFENPTPELAFPNDPDLEYERAQQFQEMALEQIRYDPGQSIRLIPIKAIGAFRGNIEGFEAAQLGTDLNLTWLIVLTYILYLVLVIMAMLYPVMRWRRLVHGSDQFLPAPELGGLFVLYIMAVAAVFFGETRFSFPVIPFVLMYAAALIVMFRPQVKPES